MYSTGTVELDMIEELRLRRWARENYVPRPERAINWHPVVLDEMEKKDRDLTSATPSFSTVA
jgi:hypothetical protein